MNNLKDQRVYRDLQSLGLSDRRAWPAFQLINERHNMPGNTCWASDDTGVCRRRCIPGLDYCPKHMRLSAPTHPWLLTALGKSGLLSNAWYKWWRSIEDGLKGPCYIKDLVLGKTTLYCLKTAFSQTDLLNSDLSHASTIKCVFNDSMINDGTWSHSRHRGTKFSLLCFDNVNLSDAKFVDCPFKDVYFNQSDLSNVEFINSTFQSDLVDSNEIENLESNCFSNVIFRGCTFNNEHLLAGANLKKVIFVDCTIRKHIKLDLVSSLDNLEFRDCNFVESARREVFQTPSKWHNKVRYSGQRPKVSLKAAPIKRRANDGSSSRRDHKLDQKISQPVFSRTTEKPENRPVLAVMLDRAERRMRHRVQVEIWLSILGRLICTSTLGVLVLAAVRAEWDILSSSVAFGIALILQCILLSAAINRESYIRSKKTFGTVPANSL